MRDPEIHDTQAPLATCPLPDQALVDLVCNLVEASTATMRMEMRLYQYQMVFMRRIIESTILRDADTMTALFSRQAGKTETCATVAIGLAMFLPNLAQIYPGDNRLRRFQAGFKIGIFAPIQEQSLFSYKRIKKFLQSKKGEAMLRDPDLNLRIMVLRADEMMLSNGSEVIARSASTDTQSEGHTFHLVICDEAHKLTRHKVEHDIRPSLASTAGSMVKIGTAWMSRGGFHNDIEHNINLLKRGGVRNHFEFNYQAVLKERERAYQQDKNDFHLNYSKFLKKEIARIGGVNTEEFQMNYALKWSESRQIAFKEATIFAGRDLGLELNVPRQGKMMVASMDVAKSNDETVLTVIDLDLDHPSTEVATSSSGAGGATFKAPTQEERALYYPKRIVGLQTLQGAFEGGDGQYQAVINFLSMFNISLFLVDATGMGDPVWERMTCLLPNIEVQPFRYSLPSKSDLYKYYMQEWNAGRVTYPYGPAAKTDSKVSKFEQQHINLERSLQGNYVRCEAPEGEHDDFPDSAALAVHCERLMKETFVPYVNVAVNVPRAARRARPAMAGNFGRPGPAPATAQYDAQNAKRFIAEAKGTYGREYRYVMGRGGRR